MVKAKAPKDGKGLFPASVVFFHRSAFPGTICSAGRLHLLFETVMQFGRTLRT